MAEITASMIKELRERTGAPIVECKKVLTEVNGSMIDAQKILLERFGNNTDPTDKSIYTSIIEIGPGFEVCPSCKSDNWKSAKMVVLEGTTHTEGNISGTSTDPGAFSGGFREFILSDRWFSWDHKIELKAGLTAKSGLVEEVKRLMLANASMMTMPAIPEKPNEVRIHPKKEPKKPSEPTSPITPELPKDQPWQYHFASSVKVMTYLSIFLILSLAFFIGPISILIGFALWVLFLPINLVRSLSGNKRLKEEYEESLRKYPEAVDKYQSDLQLYHHNLKLYRLERDRAKEQIEKNKEIIAINERNIAEYEIQILDHEVQKNNVLKARELLWERSRVCMRCGTAYLGEIM